MKKAAAEPASRQVNNSAIESAPPPISIIFPQKNGEKLFFVSYAPDNKIERSWKKKEKETTSLEIFFIFHAHCQTFRNWCVAWPNSERGNHSVSRRRDKMAEFIENDSCDIGRSLFLSMS